MTHNQQDIELMISDLPKHRALSSLDESFYPQRRHIKAGGRHLPIPTRPRKIVNCLTEYFQSNPITLDTVWNNSGIPYFLDDVKRQFSEDKDVKELLENPILKNFIAMQNL